MCINIVHPRVRISTIGFGDIVPGQSLDAGSQDRLIICCAYMLLGMALVAMCFKLMQDDVVQKARWLGQKIGILGACIWPASACPICVFTVKEESSESESDYEEDEFEEEDEGEEEEVGC